MPVFLFQVMDLVQGVKRERQLKNSLFEQQVPARSGYAIFDTGPVCTTHNLMLEDDRFVEPRGKCQFKRLDCDNL